MRRLLLRFLVVLVAVSAGLTSAPAVAQDSLSIEVHRRATLLDGGQSVAVRATVTCPAGATVLEAFLYLTQQGNESEFAFFQPTCDGLPHDMAVLVRAVDFVFVRGRAQVSGYMLLTSGETTSPTGVVKLRPEKHS